MSLMTVMSVPVMFNKQVNASHINLVCDVTDDCVISVPVMFNKQVNISHINLVLDDTDDWRET